MDEWLDIVDGDDRVIGRDTRFNIHQQSLFHRSAHVVLFNTQGKVFLQLRSMSKDAGAGLWDTSAAGHVDSGESYLQCAVRELEEELGVSVAADKLEFVGKLAPEERNGFEFTTVFTTCSDQTPVLQEEEIDDGRWLSANELESWLKSGKSQFTEVFQIIWTLMRNHK